MGWGTNLRVRSQDYVLGRWSDLLWKCRLHYRPGLCFQGVDKKTVREVSRLEFKPSLNPIVNIIS